MKHTRRRKVKPKPNVELQTVPKPARLPVWGRRLWMMIFILILLSSIGLKIYKADYSGLIYDEVLTFQDYGHSLSDAVGKFNSTNNHVLNSVFVCFGYTLFDSYIHFVRIFSLTAGVLFSLALAYVVYKTIQSRVLRAATLAWISFIPFVFDYSYYARGYAYMLMAVMGQFALLVFLMDHKIRFRSFWMCSLAMGLLNFISLGALISSVLPILAMNVIFVFFYSRRIFRDAPGRWRPIVLTGTATALVTGISLCLLFRHIYDQILNNPVFQEISGEWFGWHSFVNIFRRVFLVQVFQPNTPWAKILYWTIIALPALAILFHLYSLARVIRTRIWRVWLKHHPAGNLVLLVTVLTVGLLYFYGVILNQSLGLDRNNVVLIPLILLSGAILLDRALCQIPHAFLRYGLCCIAASAMTAALIHKPVSPHFSYSRGASLSRPVLRKLHQYDPSRAWVIAFHPRFKSWALPFSYYGYHTKFYPYYRLLLRRPAPTPYSNVEIWPLNQVPAEAVCLERDFFAGANCAVILKPKTPPKPRPPGPKRSAPR